MTIGETSDQPSDKKEVVTQALRSTNEADLLLAAGKSQEIDSITQRPSQIGAKSIVKRYAAPSVETISRNVNFLRKHLLFALCVIVPTTASTVYYGLFASDVYISESRFVVRMPQRQQSTTLLGAIFQGGVFAKSQDDTYSVHDYVLSRDALIELEKSINIRESFGNARIDTFSRFPNLFDDPTFEALYKHYIKHVTVNYDTASSITTLRVRTFDANDSERINGQLLLLGEALVNRMNTRGRDDLVKFAAAEVAEAETKARRAAAALANFRAERGVFDPDRQSNLQLQLVSKLQDELIATRTQLIQIRTLSPENPQLAIIRQRIKSLQDEIDSEMAKVAGPNTTSLTSKSAQYERLTLDRAFAEKQLTSALSSLESARSESIRKQIYLERIVQPRKPDEALEPKRGRAIFSTLLMGLAIWGILGILIAGIKEHKD